MSATELPPNESVMTVLNGASLRATSIPTLEKSLFMACISWLTYTRPVAYSILNCAFWPALMPSPHWPDPVPGLVQVLTPPALTVQPLSVSSFLAADTSYGYGLCFSKSSAKLHGGWIGTGP